MTQLEVIQRFRSWDGLSRLEGILADRRRRPNFFRLAPRVLRVEGVHSDLLAWLLDPQGWHGLGDAFVVPFLGESLGNAGFTVDGSMTDITVEKEASTGEGPIDVLVRAAIGGKRYVIGIENKIDAPLGNAQLERYARGLVGRSPGSNVVVILLAPEESDVDPPGVEGCRFLETTYRRVASHLEAALSRPDIRMDHAGTELARHYLDTLRTNIVPEGQPDVDRILREMLTEHKEAWRVIRTRLPSEGDDAHAALAKAICERLAARYGPPWQFNLRRSRYVRVFRPAWACVGQSEAEPVIGLDGTELTATKYPTVHFRLTARPGNKGPERWDGEVKLKVRGKNDESTIHPLREALDRAGWLSSEARNLPQFTVDIKTTVKLAPIEHGVVPDAVVEWFLKHAEPVVTIVDECLGKGSDSD